MRTRSSSNLVGESSPNPTTSNPKRRNRRRSKQPFSLEESPLDTMADQRTMAELLRAPTEGYAEAIVVPPILAEHFELKHSLINMMTSDQFFGLEKDNPHDHIRWFNKIKYKDVPNSAIKLMLFPFSLAGAARRWLEKEPPRSILTWEDLVSKFINEFFPPSRTTNLRNEISNFQQCFDESNPPPASVKAVEEICVTCGGAHPYYQCLTADGNTFLEFQDNIQGYVSAVAVNYNQGELKAITTRSGLVLDGPSVPMPPPFINPEEDERAEETLTDPELAEYTIKVPPPLVQKAKPTSLKNYVVHQRDPRHPHIPYPSRMHQEKQQEKDEVQIHKFWQMFKQLHINISLADALILIPKYQKMLKSLLSNKEKLLELANTPLNENCSAVILKKLPEKLGDPRKFLIPCGFSELKCKALADLGASINLMPLSVWKKLGLPELISTRMTLELANRAICTPAGIARDVFVPVGKFTFPADFVIVDYESDPPSPSSWRRLSFWPLSTTSSSPDHLLEEFADELALITFPPGNDDLPFDIESDLREIEYLLNHDPTKEMDSILEDSVDEGNLADPNNDLTDNDECGKILYDDPFDSKEDKIKESKLLIDELDPPRSSDFLPSTECDSILYEDFSKADALPSTNNEEKVFNPGIFIHENLFEVTIRATPDKNVNKIFIYNASLILKDFNPPLYELPFHKEVPVSETLLSFSSENEEKVFNPGILTSKGVRTSLLSKLSYRGPKAFKVIKIFESPMEIFPCSYREDIRILDVPCLHFYPP
ncbi:reverse transcriptase domain-containing protein [Tanacetum coccineum]